MIPKIEITEDGISVPTTQQINEGVWQFINYAFGGNVSRVQGTPQYQLATSWTATIRDSYDQFVQLANQFDPRYATGIYQDAIGELYFMTRKQATHSICPVVFEGLSGSPIPTGFAVQDISGRTWLTSGSASIGANGRVTITCTCEIAGAIEALPNSIIVIPTNINGLDRVYNEVSAIMGVNEESRQNFEERRKESVALNAKMTDASIRGSVANIADVVDVWVKSNYSTLSTTFGSTNYPVPPHGIVVSVVGGNDHDVAKQALIKGGTGAPFVGNTLVTVLDDDSYPDQPPEYFVRILRPTLTTVKIQVQVENIGSTSVQHENQIKQAVSDASKNGSTRARIGKSIISNDYVNPVAVAVPLVRVISIKCSFDGSLWVDMLPIGINQFPVINPEDVSVV